MRIITLLSLSICLVLPQLSLAYNDKTTHPGLTEQVVEFYNLNNDLKINSADKELIIQGSVDEDIVGRPLNHFYDPVRGIGINDYRTAIDWATENNNGNEFTWGKSIEKYAKGDREGALIGLGHILHLTEDMTVPDHTRNDPHMGEGGIKGIAGTGNSPYEDWAKENKMRETMDGVADYYKSKGFSPRRGSGSIEDYFTNISAYSNNNYFSPDSIENSIYQYNFPLANRVDEKYAYGADSYFYDDHLLYNITKLENGKTIKGLVGYYDNNSTVLEDYFTRLSKMAILSGAGVVEMFFSEAEEARRDYLEAEAKRLAEEVAYEAEKNSKLNDGGFIRKIWYWTSYAVTDTASTIAGAVSNTFATIGSGIYNGGSLAFNNTKNTLNGLAYTNNELATIAGQKIEAGVEKATKTIISASKKVVLYVKENSSSYITPAVAYTPPSVQDPSPTLTPAQIEQIVAILSTPSGTNNAGQDEDDKPSRGGRSHSSVTPKVEETVSTSTATTTEDIATSTATTTEETATSTATTTDDTATTTATTTDETATTTATTTDDVATTTATTTEPVIDTEAPEFIFAISEPCLNSSPDDICLIATTTVNFIFIASSTDIAYYTINMEDEGMTATTSESNFSMDFEDRYTYQITFTATDDSGNTSEPIPANVDINTHPVVINEVAWMGTASSTYDEWIELANMTSYDIDIAGWTLTDGDDINISLADTLGAEAFYLLERTDDTTVNDITADQIYTGALRDSGEVLTLSSSLTIIDQTPSGVWAAGVGGDGKITMERSGGDGTDSSNWHTYYGDILDGVWNINGTPRAENSSYVPEMI
jgi:hypothetical protein